MFHLGEIRIKLFDRGRLYVEPIVCDLHYTRYALFGAAISPRKTMKKSSPNPIYAKKLEILNVGQVVQPYSKYAEHSKLLFRALLSQAVPHFMSMKHVLRHAT